MVEIKLMIINSQYCFCGSLYAGKLNESKVIFLSPFQCFDQIYQPATSRNCFLCAQITRIPPQLRYNGRLLACLQPLSGKIMDQLLYPMLNSICELRICPSGLTHGLHYEIIILVSAQMTLTSWIPEDIMLDHRFSR